MKGCVVVVVDVVTGGLVRLVVVVMVVDVDVVVVAEVEVVFVVVVAVVVAVAAVVTVPAVDVLDDVLCAVPVKVVVVPVKVLVVVVVVVIVVMVAAAVVVVVVVVVVATFTQGPENTLVVRSGLYPCRPKLTLLVAVSMAPCTTVSSRGFANANGGMREPVSATDRVTLVAPSASVVAWTREMDRLPN